MYPLVTILIAPKLNVLRYERSTSYRESLVPGSVVNLRKSVGMSDKLTGWPLSELAEIPGEISSRVVLCSVL